ncbi:MAG TPA: hypothetical protein VK914_10195 [bacterium]|nr:hypothetical protein [bacterium]
MNDKPWELWKFEHLKGFRLLLWSFQFLFIWFAFAIMFYSGATTMLRIIPHDLTWTQNPNDDSWQLISYKDTFVGIFSLFGSIWFIQRIKKAVKKENGLPSGQRKRYNAAPMDVAVFVAVA